MPTLNQSALTLADHISTALIIPRLHGSTTSQVMQELTQALHREDEAVPITPFRALAALNLDLLTGMSLDFGAAFPQVFVPELTRPRFAVGRTAEPLWWRARCFPPIQLVFLAVGSSKTDPDYRHLRAGLLRLGKDRLRVEQLLAAHDAEQMLEVLAHYPIEAAEAVAPGRA